MTKEHRKQLDDLIGLYGVGGIAEEMADHLEKITGCTVKGRKALLHNVALLRNTANCVLKEFQTNFF